MKNYDGNLPQPATDLVRDAFIKGETRSELRIEESQLDSVKGLLTPGDREVSFKLAEFSVTFKNISKAHGIYHVQCRDSEKNADFYLNLKTGEYLLQGDKISATLPEFINLAIERESQEYNAYVLRFGLELMLDSLYTPERETIPFSELQPDAAPLIEDLLESGGECWNEHDLEIIRESIMIALMDRSQQAELMYLAVAHSNPDFELTLSDEDFQIIIDAGLSEATSEQIYAILTNRETFFILADRVLFHAFANEESPWKEYIPDVEIPEVKPLNFRFEDGEES